jgi:amidase
MSVTTAELWQMSAVELAEAIRSRRTSCQEVMESHLKRIEAVNPAVNAVPFVLGEQALQAAKAADRALADGGDLPALHGVPFTVKANIDLLGTPTTLGARAFDAAYPSLDAPVVERLKAAGGIPIGRTNLPTFAVRWHTESELWGATVNPWDRFLTPGASSGGEAAALATGMTPLGLGTDGLGSLRWPAQCCGVCALKPTLGRVPHASTLEPRNAPIGVQLTAVEGPIARRVADLRITLNVIAGPTWRDPWTVPVPLHSVKADRPIGVAVVMDPAGQGTGNQVQDGVRMAAGALADAGYEVAEVEPPSIGLAAKILLDMLSTPDIRAGWQLISASMPVDTNRFMSAFFEVAGDADPVTTVQSFIIRQSLLQSWGEFQENHPLVLAPICTDTPFEAGKDLTVAEVAEIVRGMRMSLAVNALGLPAVAVPVGVAAGLPQAVQLVGPRYGEDLCLNAAASLEDRFGTITPIDPRQPSVSRTVSRATN